MICGEFTGPSEANNVFRGLLLNSNPSLVNDQCRDIISTEILNYQICNLVHCYTLDELMQFVTSCMQQACDMVLMREIIPNNQGIGLVRKITISSESNLKVLQENLCKRFRYYFLMRFRYEQEAGEIIRYLAVTYNPDIAKLKCVRLPLDEGKSVCCSVLQAGSIANNMTRPADLVLTDEQNNSSGVLKIYDINTQEDLEIDKYLADFLKGKTL